MIYCSRLAALVVVCAGVAGGADPEVISDEQITVLVGQLASPNRPPPTGVPNAEDAPGYDQEAQKKVLRAFHQLRGLAPRSFPFLFGHVSDERYSLTVVSGKAGKNFSVGQVCREILTSNLQSPACRRRTASTNVKHRPYPPDYLSAHKLFQPDEAKEWWESRKNKSLRELQIEVLEWTLIEEIKASDRYLDEDRERLRKALRDLRASRNPLEPGTPFSA